jgi:hypothetical protein
MNFHHLLVFVISFLSIRFSTASAIIAPGVYVRNAPNTAESDTYLAVRRGLAAATLGKRQTFKSNETTLQRSWSGATILSVYVPLNSLRDIASLQYTCRQSPNLQPQKGQNKTAALEVTCTTCYVNGKIRAELQIDDDFNATQLISNTTASIRTNVKNLTNSFEAFLEDYARNIPQKLADGFDWSDLELPTFPFAFDIDVPEIPESNLKIEFNDLELYLEFDTVLAVGATYEISLFASQTPIGIKVGSRLQLGVVAAVDLILDVCILQAKLYIAGMLNSESFRS